MSPLFAALPPGDLPTHAYVAPTGVHATAPLAAARSESTHTVSSGETVYGIAARYGVSPQAIVRANSLSQGGRWIMPGARLIIPGDDATVAAPTPSGSSSASSSGSSSGGASSGSTVTVRAGDTLYGIAARHGTTVSALARINNISNTRLIYPGQTLRLSGSPGSSSGSSASSTASSGSSSGGASSGSTVTVRAGDTLYGIAARHGTTVSALARINNISNTRLIYPGQTLRLSGSPGSSSGSSSASSGASGQLSRPYDENTIGDLKAGESVPNTFLHYRYSDGVARSAAANRDYLASVDVPSREAMRDLIVATSERHGVDPQLMLAVSYQESGWNHRAVSPANAIGAMQVIPSSGDWASGLIGRELNLLDPQDNVTAGVVIMRALLRSAESTDHAIGGYYQGLGSVRQYGLFADTRQYVRNIKHLMTTL